MEHLIIKITSNALVRLVAVKENCFHEPFKTIKTGLRISKFIRQLFTFECRPFCSFQGRRTLLKVVRP